METRLIHTRHPLLIDTQENKVAEFHAGESLYAFLARNVERFGEEQIVVSVGGEVIDCAEWHRYTLKDKSVIEVRNVVKRTVLYLVAMVVLAYFTMGASLGATAATSYTAFGVAWGSAFAANLAIAAVAVAGSLLINKVLGPKPPSLGGGQPDPVHHISSSRNQIREFQPPGLLFGTVKIAPDLISRPYTYFRGNEQYLAMILTPGFNVASIEPLYNGETLLTDYEGVSVWHSNYSDMPEQKIPLLTNVDQVAGGEMDAGTWIVRTTSPDTLSISMDFEYVLFDKTSKGKDKSNTETLVAEYRPVGTSAWATLWTRTLSSYKTNTHRLNVTQAVPQGQYETRVRRLGNAIDFLNGVVQFRYVSMTSIQPDNATYQGFPRTGVEIMASGQLNGAPDTLRTIAHSKPIEVWNGTEWVLEETSNPGAHALRYIRGIYDEGGALVAGIGLPDNLIDIESWKGFMLHCADMGFTYDHWITDARNHWEVLQPIMLAGMGKIAWPTGRISALWVAEDQPTRGVVNMATIKRGSFQIDYTLARSADGIEYTYYDATDWSAKVIRVPAPGVTTMLHPARLSGEGVTNEAQAAFLARYHLAQSIYQYKDIVYATDIEALTYHNMSMLDLQHDLTQWGYGGRLVDASINGGVVTVQLDEPVPMPETGNAYVGLRIPGEVTCRIFQVQPFVGESDTLTLVDAWPADAALPGDTEANPAHDTIWMYDFSASPGARVRVVGMEMDSDLRGANVAVVQEGDEFWHYVRTGEYIPPAGESLLDRSPIASNLKITEIQQVQGDTVYTELQATFDISGYAINSVVLMADSSQVFEEVAQTTTRTAQWRIPGPGTYTIVVRPVGEAGRIGKPASVIYTTIGADTAPILHDYFNVVDQEGGIRRYDFGFHPDSNRSPNMAGVEIRYVVGTTATPDWETMDPIGAGDGFFTAPFDAAIPVAGTYTFALRTRNTSGVLSTGMLVKNVTLNSNVGEIISDIEDGVTENTQDIIDLFEESAQLAQDMAAGFLQEASNRAAAVQAMADDLQAEIDTIQSQLTDIIAAPDWNAATTYAPGDLVKHEGNMYRSKTTNTNQEPPNATHWENLGQYASLGELVAANSTAITGLQTSVSSLNGTVGSHTSQITALDSRIANAETANTAQSTAIGALQTTTTAHGNTLSTQASQITGLTSRITGAENVNSAQATALSGLTTRMNNAEGNIDAQATQITNLQTEVAGKASTSALTALTTTVNTMGDTVSTHTGQITALTTAVNGKANTSAVTALSGRVDTVEGNITAQADQITALRAGLGSNTLVLNPSFEYAGDWDTSATQAANGRGVLPADTVYMGPHGLTISNNTYINSGAGIIRFGPNMSSRVIYNRVVFPVQAGQIIRGGMQVRTLAGTPMDVGTRVSLGIRFMDADGVVTNDYGNRKAVPANGALAYNTTGVIENTYTAPAGAVTGQFYVHVEAFSASYLFADSITASMDTPADRASASALNALDVRVEEAEGEIEAQATDIGQLAVSIGTANASITTLQRVTADAQANYLIIPNPGFEFDYGWGQHNASGPVDDSSLVTESAFVGTSPHGGVRVMRFGTGAGGTTSSRYNSSKNILLIDPSQRIRVVAWTRVTQAPTSGTGQLRIFVGFYDAAGNYISDNRTDYAATNHNWTRRVTDWFMPPAGSVYCRIVVGITGARAPMYAYWDDLLLEAETPLVQSVNAKVGLYLDVNGNISGYETTNNGVTSSFKILTDLFQLVSPGSGQRLEFSGGNLRVYDTASTRRVRLGVW